jgi:hypothetical protein
LECEYHKSEVAQSFAMKKKDIVEKHTLKYQELLNKIQKELDDSLLSIQIIFYFNLTYILEK